MKTQILERNSSFQVSLDGKVIETFPINLSKSLAEFSAGLFAKGYDKGLTDSKEEREHEMQLETFLEK